MTIRSTADDVMRFVLQSRGQSNAALERALVVQLSALIVEVHESERAHCESAAMLASTLASEPVREMAAHVLALHGSPAAFAVLRFLADHEQRELRLAAQRAISAIETRERVRREVSARALAVVPWQTAPTQSSEKAS